MCGNHYTQWRRKHPIQLAKSDTRERLLEAMPGTTKQLAESLGIKYETARKAIRKMHAEGLVHIEDHLPPVNQGRDYMSVFSAGAGVDHKVTKKQRHEDHLAARRAWYRRNEARPRLTKFDLVMMRMAA
jgi:predicted ArsR family transcriptional regulator